MQKYMLAKSEVVVFPNKEDLSIGAADQVVKIAQEAVKTSGRFTLSLSGGSTPKALYALLASDRWANQMPWDKTFLFWGDERCVSRTSSESNFKMVKEALTSHVPIPESHIIAPLGQDINPVQAACDYEQAIRQFFQLGEGKLPIFDLVLLGLGPEGHTASIFPESPVIDEIKKLVVSYLVDGDHGWRLTLTLPVINAAHNIIFLVAGAEKKDILGRILSNGDLPNRDIPATLIRPVEGKLSWYIDSEASGELKLG